MRAHRPAASSCGPAVRRSKPWQEATFCATVERRRATVNHAWFRGGWFDAADHGLEGRRRRAPATTGRPSPRARRRPARALFVPFRLAPGAVEDGRAAAGVVRGTSPLRVGKDPAADEPVAERRYRPWYAGRFPDIEQAAAHWRAHYAELRAEDRSRFSDCFYDTTLPARGRRGRRRQPDDPEVADGAAPGRRPPVGLGRLQRQRRLLPRLLHARLELRPGAAAPLPGAGADAARDGVRRRRRTTRGHQTFRAALPDPAGRARLPRRRRRPARRHHEGLPRVAHQRRHRRGCARCGRRSRRASTTASRPGTRGHKGVARGAAPQHLRHRVLGPGRHVHQLLPRRAAAPRC